MLCFWNRYRSLNKSQLQPFTLDNSGCLPPPLLSRSLPCAMATVTWAFGPSGFAVGVSSHGAIGEAEVNGDMPATGLNISFRRLNVGGPIPTTTVTDAQGNATRVAVSPPVSFSGLVT